MQRFTKSFIELHAQLPLLLLRLQDMTQSLWLGRAQHQKMTSLKVSPYDFTVLTVKCEAAYHLSNFSFTRKAFGLYYKL